jgi:trehalose 6-phosphate synthase/phosphatase
VDITETGAGLEIRRSPGGLASAMSRVWDRPGSLWVGWSGMDRSLSLKEFKSLVLGEKLALVNLESDLHRGYYQKFANGSLWPVLHGFEPRAMYTPADFAAAVAVNERFARCLESILEPDDVIWVHDFHLALLPGILRRRGVRNRVGFFLHVPFPEPGAFAWLPDHSEIARSIAEADVVGMQTPRDVDRWQRYLERVMIARAWKAEAFPIGIDYERYNSACDLPEAHEHRRELDRRYDGKTVIFSASRLDYTKGIARQLRAVEGLIKSAPNRRELIYKLVVVPSREDLEEYQELKTRTAELVAEINGRYGDSDWQPVDYEYGNLGLEGLAAWYGRADVMLVAPVIDGMNLIAKEYVAAHGDDGVLVLGRGAGAAGQLQEAVLVDPDDADDMVDGLRQALAMPQAERARRMRAMREVVAREDVSVWADDFLRKLTS